MRSIRRILGIMLAFLFLVCQVPFAPSVAHATSLEDQFIYPKISYSAEDGMTTSIITMSGAEYLVYTITKSGTLTVNGTYPSDIWLAGGGADGGSSASAHWNNFAAGGGGGYTTNVFSVILRSGNVTIGAGGGGTTSFVHPDPGNPGYTKTYTAAGGDGIHGGSGAGSGGRIYSGGVKLQGLGQGKTTRPFAAAEMPAYCQGGYSQGYGDDDGSWAPNAPGSDGGNGGYGTMSSATPPTGTGGVGGGLGGKNKGTYATSPGGDATAFGGGGGGGNPGGKGYQGAMMIRIPLTALLPADYTAVDNAIIWANSLPQSNYVDFSQVLEAIEAVDRTKVASEQSEVDNMAETIIAAVRNLQSAGADYSIVNDLAAYAMNLNPTHYSNYHIITEAFSKINWEKSIEQQGEVNAMAQALFAAIQALVPLPADYSAVDAALAIIEGLPDPSYYVTFEGIRTAVGTVVRGKPKAQQAEVDAMAQTLIAAINSLQLYPADYSRVDQYILRAAELEPSLYTNYDNVITAARSVNRNLSIIEQPQVDMMATSLMVAIENLELIEADYSGVDLAISYANGLDSKNYTNFSAVTTAINAVVRGKSIDEQEAVDKMAEDIVKAILSLKYAPTPTASPSPGNTPTPTTPPTTSNGITLEQLQALLKSQGTTTTTKLNMPKTGDKAYLWGAIPVAVAIPAVIYCFRPKKKRRA